jgi:uncharacterized protein YeaO (DUF488 family)
MAVKIKRIYEPAAKSDGYRVLVDRLWPRGIKREQAAIDEWTRDVAPSQELRRWFGHDPERSTSSGCGTSRSSTITRRRFKPCGTAPGREP